MLKHWTGTRGQRIAVAIIFQVSKCLAVFALVMLAVAGIQYAQSQPIQVPPAHSTTQNGN